MLQSIMNQYIKLCSREYKNKHDRIEKGILRELHNRHDFVHVTKGYQCRTEVFLQNYEYKTFWMFEIRMDVVIHRRSNLKVVEKKSVGMVMLVNNGMKEMNTEKRTKYQDFRSGSEADLK